MDPTTDAFDRDEVAALLAMLYQRNPSARVAALEALVRLPLAPDAWREVGGYAADALLTSTGDERCAVIDASPWIPLRSVRRAVAHLAREGDREAVEGGGDVRSRAERATWLVHDAAMTARRSQEAATVQPGRRPPSSPIRGRLRSGRGPEAGLAELGFVRLTAADRSMVEAELAMYQLLHDSGTQQLPYPFHRLRVDTMAFLFERGLAPVAVTALFDQATREPFGVAITNEVVSWVEGVQDQFQPDLDGLFSIYARLAEGLWSAHWLGRVPVGFSEDLEIHDRWLCWQVGWVASRGGLLALVRGLSPHLTSGRDEERMAAAYLIADAADYRQRGDAPHFGGGFAPDRQPVPIDLVDEQPESGVPIGVGVLLPSPRPAPGLALDDDVQFTVYRPGRVRAERWYPLLAFAHRTDPVEGPDGSLIDPTVVVEQQAQALLAAEPARFDSVSTDSTGAVLRGSDLLFEPWLDGGEVNPPRASVRWEEPVHRVEFRIRAPAAADGQILSGGLRVFMGVVLIGEVGFRVSVRSSVGEHAPLGALPVRRYRQIFASYSHRDVEVVRAVAHIGSLIGDSYLIDTQVLRSGEQWEPRLAEVIEQADVFQLFWSHNAMQSTFVQSEWEHALALGRDGFVHPVYWEEPLPADPARGLPPKSLGKLHFSRLGAEPAPVAGPLSQGFTPGPPSAAGPPPSPPPPPPPPPAVASPTTPPPSPAASPPAPPPPPSATPAADSTVRAPQMDDEYAGAPSDVAAQPGYAPGNWRSGYPAASRPPAPRSSRRLLGIAALVATLVVLVVLLALIL